MRRTSHEHRTTLVFVNTRRLAERVAHAPGGAAGRRCRPAASRQPLARSCGSMRKQRLKNGELRAVVATASLELGIDIGTVDLVCQIGSPRSIAVALQRIGRVRALGRRDARRAASLPTTRDELIECAALVHAIRARRARPDGDPASALDILAQQIVAETAVRDMAAKTTCSILCAARIPIAILRARRFRSRCGDAVRRHRDVARPQRRFLHRDQVNDRVRGRRGARLAAITSGGAIPTRAHYQVVAEPEGTTVGTLDEDFAVESLAGDVFLLGTHSWRIRRVEPGRVRVEDAHGAAPSIPFWRGEAPGRRASFPQAVSELREQIASTRRSRAGCMPNAASTMPGAEQAVAYVRAGGARSARCRLPTRSSPSDSSTKPAACNWSCTRRSGRASIAPGDSRCASDSAGRSISSCKRRRPTTALCISLSEQHSSRSKSFSTSCTPQQSRRARRRRCSIAPMFGARWRWNAIAGAGDSAFPGRTQSAAADSAHALRRFAGGRVSRPGGLRRESRRARFGFPIIRW